MTILAELEGSITVTADPSPFLLGFVAVTGEGGFDIGFTLTNRAGVAAAQRFQRFGARVDIDRGDGVMVTLPDSTEVGRSLVIEESSDSFGDRCTFSVIGEKFSPFARDWLRARSKIEVYYLYGSPQHEYIAKVFTGYIIQSTHSIQPAKTDVVALDAAGLYAERRAKEYALPANSGKTRLEIATELLTIGEIPRGFLDFGLSGGGVYNKAVSLGDRPILDFLRDFLAVIGVEIGFIDVLLVAVRFDASYPPVAELYVGNICGPPSGPSPTITGPATLDPNVLGVVSVKTTSEEPSGLRVEEGSSITIGPFAPAEYEFVQDDGVLTANSGGPVERVQTISEVITRTSFFGTLDVRYEQTVRGWYAPRAAAVRVRRTGSSPDYDVEQDFIEGTVFIFPDGSTRATYAEVYGDTRRTIRTKELDDERRVTDIREERYFWRGFKQALFEVDFLSSALRDVPPLNWTPVGDDGNGLLGGQEFMGGPFGYGTVPDELVLTHFEFAEDGTITEETVTEHFHDVGAQVLRRDGAFGYGLDESERTYRSKDSEAGSFAISSAGEYNGRRVTTKRYRNVDEDHFEVTELVSFNGGTPTVKGPDVHVGQAPRPAKAEATSSSQEIRASFKDQERIDLAGEEIEDMEPNEFVQDETEAAAYAKIRARKAAARVLSCETTVEGLIHKWVPVIVSIPGASIDGEKFYVRGVTRDAGTMREGITAEWYPPHVT